MNEVLSGSPGKRVRWMDAALVVAICSCGSSGTPSTSEPVAQAPIAGRAQHAAAGRAGQQGGAVAGARASGAGTGGSAAAGPAAPVADGGRPAGGASGASGAAAAGASGAGAPAPAGQAGEAGIAGTAGAAAGGAGAPSTPWQWPTGEPEAFGIQRAALDRAADAIQRSTGNRYGMVVVRKGTLIYEKYWQGTADDRHIIYSCTKSWGSTLVGIAVTKGLLTVRDEVRKWIPMPAQGVAQGALLEHILTQSAHTTPPGRSFMYNSGYLLNTGAEVLGAAVGVTAHEFYQRELVQRMGLTMTWPQCPAGGCAGTRYPEGFIQFGNQPPEAPNAELPQSTVRDQAKLGWLWANNGVWEGEQIISPEYIAAGSKPGAGFRADYGYLWWIENAEQYAAIGGVGNCYVNVMPSKQLVIAVMGDDAGLGQGGGWAAFQSLVDQIEP